MAETRQVGLIIGVDGVAGCGKTTLATGLPRRRAMLDQDVDGGRWVKEEMDEYANIRDVTAGRGKLMAWADDASLASICVDNWSYLWQTYNAQVLDGQEKNVLRSWGTAKLAMKKQYDPLIRAKRAGKIILLIMHTKDDVRGTETDDGKMKVEKFGQKHDAEVTLNDYMDLHLRMSIDLKSDTRWLTVVKPRASRVVPIGEAIADPRFSHRLKDLIALRDVHHCERVRMPLMPVGARIDVPRYGTEVVVPHILALCADAPETSANGDSESEDAAAQSTMAAAALSARGAR